MNKRITRRELPSLRKDIMEIQNNRCAICSGDFDAHTYHHKKRRTVQKYKPCLDHNHSSGAIRGVLCSYCNAVEGKVLRVVRRWHPYAKTESEVCDLLYNLEVYLNYHRVNRTERIHPDHKTEEEKREHRNKKARQRYKRNKINGSDSVGAREPLS